MTITFIGHGYVGLVTACVFADFGNKVWVIGRNKKKIDRLKKGDPLIYEPGLKEILERNLKAGRLNFTLDYHQAVNESEIVFIAVGTPSKKDGSANLSSVFEVAEKIGRNLEKPELIVVCKSTVPVGTNLKIKEIIEINLRKGAKIHVASCPEFLREGSALYDTLNPDRIVIGSNSKKAIDLLLVLHKPLNGKRVITDIASAELIKYTSNAMLALKISFANLIAFYCEKTRADVEKVLDAVGLDKRIGRIFMNPGVGYGGSCLPKDVKALISMGKDLDIDVSLLSAVDRVNELSRDNFIDKILKNSKGKDLAIWGLSFKPNTDDIRYAPSLKIIERLLDRGFSLTVYDPCAMENVRRIFGRKLVYAEDAYSAVKDKEGVVIVTEWNEFRQIDLRKVKVLLRRPIIFDGRNIYDPSVLKNLGFDYYSVGRNTVKAL